MRIVFMGTPEFAVSVLDELIGSHEVALVVSQPDRARDRRGNLIPTPVKEYAQSHGLPICQFEKIKLHAEELKAVRADIFVTAAYGQILSQEIIDIPKYGIVNVHASLLPKYRGSSPIQTAILNGDRTTGVTIMQTALGMDSGDILAAKEIEIGNMNAGQLSEELAKQGARLLTETLDAISRGTIRRLVQNEEEASACRKIRKEDALIDWAQDAQKICNIIRAFNPSPVAFTTFNGSRIKIYEAEAVDCNGESGKVIFADRKNGLIVACKEGGLKIKKLQLQGKNILTDIQFLNGTKLKEGDRFGN